MRGWRFNSVLTALSVLVAVAVVLSVSTAISGAEGLPSPNPNALPATPILLPSPQTQSPTAAPAISATPPSSSGLAVPSPTAVSLGVAANLKTSTGTFTPVSTVLAVPSPAFAETTRLSGSMASTPSPPSHAVRKSDLVADPIAQVSAGNLHTCSVTVVGVAYCWGWNGSGQLGTGGLSPSLVPLMVPTGDEWNSIATGGSHTCATASGGVLKCWGDNAGGQLGGTGNPSSPAIVGTSWTQVVAGTSHSCAVTTTGSAYCWGRSDFGQVGDGAPANATARTTPVAVSGGRTWSQLSARANATCGVATTGVAYCWGQRMTPRLDGVGDFQISPALVGGGLQWREISVGGDHSCGITTANELYCWGQNASGQLGDGTSLDRPGPVGVSLTTVSWRTVSAGHSHTCAVDTANHIWCWGSNLSGQLGDGSPTDAYRKVPGLISSSLNWQSVASGQSHSCAVTDAGVTWCWGANESGQTGDGTSVTLRPLPRRVTDQTTNDLPATATPVATASPAARHIRIANVRDSGFTVAWVTNDDATGFIRWWPDGSTASQVAYDVRGSGVSSNLHYVNVSGLVPSSRYAFDIVSGVTVDANAGGHYAVTTGPTLGASSPDTATGVVEASDGSRASEAIVIISVGPTTSASPSAPMAALVTTASNGTWNANITSLRTADRSATYAFTTQTITTLEVIGGPNAFVQASVAVADLRLATRAALRLASAPFSATVSVSTGWNLIALAVDPADQLRGSEMCNRLNAAGGAGTVVEVVRWEAGAWESHRCGIAANDFSLDPDRGYFIRATKSTSIAISGVPSDPKQGRLLESGWNLIGLGTTASFMDAPTLLASLDGASGTTATALEAARWQSGAWDSHVRTAPVNRYALDPGRGYFVRLTRPVAWTNVGGSPASGITR
jgi:alpha-tubulin suppressor-like RCC1 family protein